jgi:hypothetical protein
MKKLVGLLICIASAFISKGQSTEPEPIFIVWYEYGDGKFFKTSFNNEADLESGIALLPNATGPNVGFKKVIPIYAPPPGPPIKSISKRTGVIGHTTGNLENVLNNELEILTSSADFLKTDTVQFALHYNKSKTPGARKVAFFYNSNANTTFLPINTPASAQLIVPEKSTGVLGPVRQVRTHNTEVASTATAALLASVLTPSGGNYKNGIVFTLPSTAAPIKNIFVSLITNEDETTDDDENFKLVFLSETNQQLKSTNGNLTNHKKLPSHDPNYEIVQPNCIVASATATVKAAYDVHFQNTGKGPAESVLTNTKLPDNYTVSDIVGWSTGTLSGITAWKIGGVTNNPNYDVTNLSAPSSNLLTLSFKRKSDARAVVSPSDPARSEEEVLVGTAGSPDPLNDVRTMGEFQFKLQLKAPAAVPIDLNSYTGIIFDENPVVYTDTAKIRIRDCCTCPDKGPANNGNGNGSGNNEPRRCKWKSRFLRWLLCEDC